jgi:hypothetical protein
MRTFFRRLLVASALNAVAVSCGTGGVHEQQPGDGGSNTGGNAGSLFGESDGGEGGGVGRGPASCQIDGDCGPGGLCDPSRHTCGCGGTQVQASDVPPNLLIVMDRSCSMQTAVKGTPKWTIAVQALSTLTQRYAGQIRFGLTLFPDRNAARCMQGAMAVPIGPGNESKIQQLLAASLTKGNASYPDGPCVTPIDAAMTQAAMDPALADVTRGDFTLLITDGQQAGCNVSGGNQLTTQAIATLLGKGARTFVVGFGSSVSVASLDSFAQAGGEANPNGPHKFYDASDQPSLDAALATIAQATLSCVLQLSQTPPNGDPNIVFVYFDKTPPPVSRDTAHQNGWDYDPKANAVIFFGAACAALKQGAVKSAEVVFGCPGGAVPPPPTH